MNGEQEQSLVTIAEEVATAIMDTKRLLGTEDTHILTVLESIRSQAQIVEQRKKALRQEAIVDEFIGIERDFSELSGQKKSLIAADNKETFIKLASILQRITAFMEKNINELTIEERLEKNPVSDLIKLAQKILIIVAEFENVQDPGELLDPCSENMNIIMATLAPIIERKKYQQEQEEQARLDEIWNLAPSATLAEISVYLEEVIEEFNDINLTINDTLSTRDILSVLESYQMMLNQLTLLIVSLKKLSAENAEQQDLLNKFGALVIDTFSFIDLLKDDALNEHNLRIVSSNIDFVMHKLKSRINPAQPLEHPEDSSESYLQLNTVADRASSIPLEDASQCTNPSSTVVDSENTAARLLTKEYNELALDLDEILAFASEAANPNTSNSASLDADQLSSNCATDQNTPGLVYTHTDNTGEHIDWRTEIIGVFKAIGNFFISVCNSVMSALKDEPSFIVDHNIETPFLKRHYDFRAPDDVFTSYEWEPE